MAGKLKFHSLRIEEENNNIINLVAVDAYEKKYACDFRVIKEKHASLTAKFVHLKETISVLTTGGGGGGGGGYTLYTCQYRGVPLTWVGFSAVLVNSWDANSQIFYTNFFSFLPILMY